MENYIVTDVLWRHKQIKKIIAKLKEKKINKRINMIQYSSDFFKDTITFNDNGVEKTVSTIDFCDYLFIVERNVCLSSEDLKYADKVLQRYEKWLNKK